ncbi:protein kinase [Aureococcus anophagefferens]|nr:protein kinase [Aureococcus anophagefferens]
MEYDPVFDCSGCACAVQLVEEDCEPYKTDYCECCSQWPWDADAGAAQYGSEYYMTCGRMDAGYYSLIYYFAADEQYFRAPGCDYNWWNEGLQAVCADSHQTGPRRRRRGAAGEDDPRGVAAGAAFTLSATETDVLGPLAGMLTGLGAVAPPPLNCCLYPFTQALAQLAVAAREDASAFLAKFSKKGAFSKLCSGTLDARTFMLLDKRLCELSGELGSALDLQQLALQTQRFQKIEGLIQLLGQQAVGEQPGGARRGAHPEQRSSAAIEELKQATLAKNESAKGKALARQDKGARSRPTRSSSTRASPAPLARARCTSSRATSSLKRMSMVGVTAPKRAKMLRDFSTELAIMVKLRSPRVVQVFGVVTTDPSFLGFVVEFLEGGDLRTAIDAEDYAAAVDEAQRRRWLGDVALGMQYLYSRASNTGT